jgi:hypothetical protein
MSGPLDKLQWHIMDAMADDWESIEQIRPHVAKYCGNVLDHQIFVQLRDLHRHGFVRLMDENGYGKDDFPAEAGKYWFDMTDAGRALWDSEGFKHRTESESSEPAP